MRFFGGVTGARLLNHSRWALFPDTCEISSRRVLIRGCDYKLPLMCVKQNMHIRNSTTSVARIRAPFGRVGIIKLCINHEDLNVG